MSMARVVDPVARPDDEAAGKKRLGRYYTPQPVASAIVGWALDQPDPVVMDPCYGGCAFLYAGMKFLQERGMDPSERLFGVDVDAEATKYLAPILGDGAWPDHFRVMDFFDVTPATFAAKNGFTAIVGNPPYVRHHLMDDAMIRKAAGALQARGVRLSRRASCWAYFVVHSLHLLRPRGRIAFVLPGAFLQAEYAADVWNELTDGFGRIYVFIVSERVFHDAEEETVVLLADGWGEPHEEIRIGVVDRVDTLGWALRSVNSSTTRVGSLSSGRASSVVGREVLDEYQALVEGSDRTMQIGEWVDVRLGIVTGANRFFIRPASDDLCKQVPGVMYPVVCRSSDLRGLLFTEEDLSEVAALGKPCQLLAIDRDCDIPDCVRVQVEKGVSAGLYRRYKCRQRTPWYSIHDREAPEAFLPYMSGSWPRIILNHTKATCTNVVHRLVWKDADSRCRENWEYLAVASLTTLFQLSVEIGGRSYGGGVLKIEPSQAKRLVIPRKRCNGDYASLLREADSLLRAGKAQEATRIVDNELLKKAGVATREQVRRFRSLCDLLRSRRIDRGRLLPSMSSRV